MLFEFELNNGTFLQDAAGEKFHTPFNVEQALDSRDGLARALYSRLFTWLVSKINKICQPKVKADSFLSIAVLDIFGFEVSLMQQAILIAFL